jgi:hypothetical protein
MKPARSVKDGKRKIAAKYFRYLVPDKHRLTDY